MNKPRGWDDAKSKKMKPLKNRNYEDGEEFEEEFDGEEEDDGDDESGEYDLD